MTEPPVVEIVGLRVFGRHGALPEEARLGQPFLFDVTLVCADGEAARTGRLDHAVDYAAVCERVAAVATGQRFALIERLADAVAGDLLARFAVACVRVRVRKPQAPLPYAFEEVAAIVVRRRGEPAEEAS